MEAIAKMQLAFTCASLLFVLTAAGHASAASVGLSDAAQGATSEFGGSVATGAPLARSAGDIVLPYTALVPQTPLPE